MTPQPLLAATLFCTTLAAVIVRPFGLGSGTLAMAGALAALASGVVAYSDIPLVWQIVQDATFTLVSLIVISLVLDAAGLFEWAALHIVHMARGHGVRLFLLLNVLGALIAALFTNDGAVLILTPLLVSVSRNLRFPTPVVLAIVLSGGFIADSASLPLVTSNLVNLIAAHHAGIGFADYARIMVPVDLVSVLASLAVLTLYYHRQLPPRHELAALPAPRQAIRDPLIFRAAWLVMPALIAGYLVSARWQIPASAIAAPAALFMLVLAARDHFIRKQPTVVIPLLPLLREAPWQVVIFSLGMYLVVYGLGKQGWTTWLAVLLAHLHDLAPWQAAWLTGMLAALLSSLMNNLPAVLLTSLAIAQQHVPDSVRQGMLLANVTGCDLGPKITPIGSLATLLWMHLLQQRGIHVGWGAYFRTGAVLTLPVLTVTLLVLGSLI
ncbi:MAG: arsenical efflux pump membrane protein ArsB [Betaproteobacteria bacterium]|nr:arsenical efflux pump membrane protein ArsB [Betaproteobacteria bacterium]